MNPQDIVKYFKIIRKWWWVILLLFGTTVGTLLAFAFLTEREYEAIVKLQVSAPPPQEVPLYSQFGRQALRDEIDLTQAAFGEFLQAGDVAWRAVEELPDVSISGNELSEKILVEVPENSQLMEVSVRVEDPETAALLANKVVEVGLQRYGELSAQPTANTRKFIEQQLVAARKELKSAEDELSQFQITHKLGELDRAIDKQYDLIRSLSVERDLSRAEGNLAKVQAIDEIIQEREIDLQDMIGLSAKYNELTDHLQRTRSTFNFLLDKETEAQIKENQILELSSIQIITSARPPRRPVAAIDNKIIVLGALASFIAGILLTFLLEYIEVAGFFHAYRKPGEPSDIVPLPDNA